MTTKAVITGASGFVGANLCRRLLSSSYEVHLLVRASFDNWRILDILPQVHVHIVDFLNPADLTKVLGAIKPDFIFHLAANGAYSFQKNTTEIFQTNILGTQNLVDAAVSVGFKAFINTGSSSEYGFKKTIHKESDIVEPNSAYSVSKVAATHYCSFVATEKKLRIPTLRLYSVYGEYEDPRRLIPTLLLNGMNSRYPPLVAPDTARDFIYIDDVMDAYLAVATKTTEVCSDIFNVSSGKQTTLKELVSLVQTLFSIKPDPVWGQMEARSWDSDCWVGSNEKIQQVLGWKPKTRLLDGLSSFTEWFRINPAIKSQYEK